MLFSLVFGFLIPVWFRIPGESDLAPIISIFFLENTILSNSGLERLLRPMIFATFSSLLAGYFFYYRKFKN
tara:strand:+ start:219 stop:431 length:213 start_codon:yes stop_codon:yes gene_type:complete